MSNYTKIWYKNLSRRNILRTPKGMTYRIVQEEDNTYSYSEMWNYINREGGIGE